MIFPSDTPEPAVLGPVHTPFPPSLDPMLGRLPLSLILTAVFLLTAPAQAQEWIDFDDAPPAPVAETPRDQGIHVQGKWTITVRNEEGSVLNEEVFNNALVATGETSLTRLLLGRDRVAGWYIDLYEEGRSSSLYTGFIDTVAVGRGNGSLTQSADGRTLILESTREIPEWKGDVSIDRVRTVIRMNSGYEPFSAKMLSSPLTLPAGRSYDVRVEFTFQ
jgi:hypothetical protein